MHQLRDAPLKMQYAMITHIVEHFHSLTHQGRNQLFPLIFVENSLVIPWAPRVDILPFFVSEHLLVKRVC